MRTCVKVLTAALSVLAFVSIAFAQDFKPWPSARITEQQWQAYFEEVNKNFGATAHDLPQQQLVTFSNEKARTVWAFTKPGNPAHPSWVTLRYVQGEKGVSVEQIGYFAGEEAEFAKLFKAYRAMVDRQKTEVLTGQPVLTKQLGEDLYELMMETNQANDVAIAQQALWPTARKLCGEKTPQMGKYQFESDEKISGADAGATNFKLRQQVRCDAAPAAAPAPAEATLVAHDDREIERVTSKYFAAVDSGNYAEGYAFLSPTMKEMSSFERWSAGRKAASDKLGGARSGRVKKVTWYDNPPGAPPGTYAAADFDRQFENARIYCGYIVWRAHGGAFELIREEVTVIDRETAAKMAPDDLQAMARRFHCDVSP